MRTAVAALLAVAVMLALAGTAVANSATIRNAGEGTLVSSGRVTFRATGVSVACNITLNVRWSTSIEHADRVSGQGVGLDNGFGWSGCNGGEVGTVLVPRWTMLYAGMTGTLPNSATSLQFTVEGMSISFSIFGGFVNCLYRGEPLMSMAMATTRTAGVYTSGSVGLNEAAYTKVSGTGCPASMTASGFFSVSPTQTITVI